MQVRRLKTDLKKRVLYSASDIEIDIREGILEKYEGAVSNYF